MSQSGLGIQACCVQGPGSRAVLFVMILLPGMWPGECHLLLLAQAGMEPTFTSWLEGPWIPCKTPDSRESVWNFEHVWLGYFL